METIKKPLIRQGWLRALIYFIVISLIVYVFQLYEGVLMNYFKTGTEAGNESILNFTIMYTLMAAVIIAVTWLIRKFIDRRSFASLGLSLKGFGNEAGLGFFGALGMLGIGTLILVAAGFLAFLSATLDVSQLLIETAFMVVVAFAEELLFRGYLLNNLMQSMNKWVALGISAVLFGLSHETNPGVSFFDVANILLAGVLLGLNYIFTKNLWFGMVFHFAWNYFQGPVLGYEVSGLKLTSVLQQSVTGPDLWTGGHFGFEGSLLCPMLLAVSIIGFGYAFIKRYSTASVADY